MKEIKMLKKLFVLAAILFYFSPAAHAVTVSSTVAQNVLPLDIVPARAKETLRYTLSGTATGQILIEKSGDNIAWAPFITFNAAGPIVPVSDLVSAGDHDSYFRWRCSTVTAGSFVVTMLDNDDFVGEFRSNKGPGNVGLYDDSIRLSHILNFNPGDTVALSSTTRLTRDTFPRTYNVLTSTGGAVLMGQLPTIATTYAVTGDIYILQSATATVTFSDNDSVAGTLLELGSTSRALGVGDILVLIYRAGKWWEMGFYNN